MRNGHKLNIDFDTDENVKEPNKLKVLWDKTYDYYWKNLGWRFREFSRNIKNLIRWFPVIWKDRDWDDHYIWEILKFKLKNQAKYIGDRDIHTSAKYDAQRMMLCVRLIDKIQEEYYSMEYMDYHESNYNWLDIDDNLQFGVASPLFWVSCTHTVMVQFMTHSFVWLNLFQCDCHLSMDTETLAH